MPMCWVRHFTSIATMRGHFVSIVSRYTLNRNGKASQHIKKSAH
ncbi:Uncharacterised protein [Vibrio cholerae]|nr:Uncharacterised protein [Vibrio cholerae]